MAFVGKIEEEEVNKDQPKVTDPAASQSSPSPPCMLLRTFRLLSVGAERRVLGRELVQQPLSVRNNIVVLQHSLESKASTNSG